MAKREINKQINQRALEESADLTELFITTLSVRDGKVNLGLIGDALVRYSPRGDLVIHVRPNGEPVDSYTFSVYASKK